MERYEADMPLGDTETTTEQPSGYGVGWETAQLSYGGNVEEETYQKIHSELKDYSKNAQYYDAWKNIEDWNIEDGKRARHELALESGRFTLDEDENILNSGEPIGVFEALIYDTDALKGALLSQVQGQTKDTFNLEYEAITKSHISRLAKDGQRVSGVESALGGLAAHIMQPETAIDFMSPGKIMGTTIAKGAAKAFATEFGFALVGETMREQRTKQHMERANLEYTLWDSVENILINSGFAGAVRGIGSAVVDKLTLNKISNSIPNKTDKEIFARYAQRENYKLTQDTNKHIELLYKAEDDLNKGFDVDVAEHLDIDIATKTDDAIEEVNVNDELSLREADAGLPEQTQKFVDEFEDTPAPQEATDINPYEGMATPQQADELINDMAIDDVEIKAELEDIQKQSKVLSDRQQQMKEAKEPKIGGSEDEAAAETQQFFRKNTSEDARYKNMSKEDIAEIERMDNEELLRTKPEDTTGADWIEANQMFAKFGDNITAGMLSGIEEDENGNITLNPEKFVIGLGGYTALKQLVKSPTIQKEFKEYIGRVLDELEGNPKFDYLTGTQRVVESGKKTDGELIVQHNLSAENILHAEEVGGLAVPSLAVTKVDAPLTGFGEITLLGHSDLIKPSKEVRVFGADVYSPRYPTINYDLSIKQQRVIDEDLAPYEAITASREYAEKDSLNALYDNTAFRAKFLDEKGVKVKLPKIKKAGKPDEYEIKRIIREVINKKNLGGELKNYAKAYLKDVGAKETIWNGTDRMGRNKYQEHTLSNVIKKLKKDIRGGENFNYGLGTARAKLTPEFKTIKRIQAEKDRLVSDADFELVKQEMDKKVDSVSDSLQNYYEYDSESFGYLGEVLGAISEQDLKGYGFNNIPNDVMQEVRELTAALQEMPTEYFEVKILKALDAGEFKAAIVPNGTSKETIELLKKKGLKVSKYNSSNEGERAKAIKRVATKEKILFMHPATIGGAIIVGAASQKEETK